MVGIDRSCVGSPIPFYGKVRGLARIRLSAGLICLSKEPVLRLKNVG